MEMLGNLMESRKDGEMMLKLVLEGGATEENGAVQ